MGAVHRDARAAEPAGEGVDEHRVHVLGASVGGEGPEAGQRSQSAAGLAVQVGQVDRRPGECSWRSAHDHEARGAFADRTDQRAQQEIGGEVVGGQGALDPLGGDVVEFGDDGGVADDDVGEGTAGKPSGQFAHLAQHGKVGALHVEVGIWDGGEYSLARIVEPLAAAPDHDDGQSVRRE
jgi:hypothetical protein